MRNSSEIRTVITRQEFRRLRPYLAALFLAVVFLVYGPFLKRHYALDTYYVEAFGNQGDQQIRLGRFLSGVILDILSGIGVNTAVSQSFFTLLALFLLALSLYLLVSLFFGLREEWDVGSLLLLCLAAVAALCHVFMLGWFLFPEVVSFMMTGLVLSILAVSFPMRYPGLKKRITCYVLLTAAISFYQAVAAFFVMFSLFSLAIEGMDRPMKEIMKGFASVFAVYVLAGVTNMAAIAGAGRLSESSARTDFFHSAPVHNLYGILQSIGEKLRNTNLGVTPIVVFCAVLGVLLLGAWFFLSRNQDKGEPGKAFLLLFSAICGSFAAIMIPHLLTGIVDVSPRSIVALLSLPGAICIFMIFRFRPSQRRMSLSLTAGFLLVFFFANTYITYSVEKSRFATNRLDREIAGMIRQEIVRYESQTGNTVRRIAFRHDTEPARCYRGLVCYGNFRAMGTNWTIVPLLSIVSGRDFQQESMPEPIYDAYFRGKNWDSFDAEQVVLKEDALYLMLF